MLKFENNQTGRYYYLITSRDLFDDVMITVIRGSKNKRVMKTNGYTCKKEAYFEIHKIIKRRLQRGYTIINQ